MISNDNCIRVELAKCMRSAGLPVKVMIESLRLFQQGNTTISARRELLLKQCDELTAQRKAIDDTLKRLDFKISRYDIAMKTGSLSWDDCEV